MLVGVEADELAVLGDVDLLLQVGLAGQAAVGGVEAVLEGVVEYLLFGHHKMGDIRLQSGDGDGIAFRVCDSAFDPAGLPGLGHGRNGQVHVVRVDQQGFFQHAGLVNR